MQRIKNIEEVILELKPLLKVYLEEQGTEFRRQLFQCPNRGEHSNNDDTPSAGFIPNTEDSIWNCFSCGFSGDIFTAYKFLEEKEINGTGWYMAVKELADRYGVECELEPLLPEEQEFNNVQTFLKALIASAHKYVGEQSVASYIQQRGWGQAVEHFELGYIPDTPKVRQFVTNAFKTYPEIGKHLLVDLTQPDIFVNSLVNRLLYPIKHRYGYILGLTSRRISEDDSRPKYHKYYTKQTEKGGILFNLTKTYKTVYVVEGASSVFTLHCNGIKNVVALSGSVLTEAMYGSLIKHGVTNLVFCLDGDKAGQKALQRAIKVTQDKPDTRIYIKELSDGKDPDDTVREGGVEAFKNIPEVSNFKYQLLLFKKAKDQEQDKLKASLFEIIISRTDAILREKMVKLFSKETGVLKTTLAIEIEKHEKTKGLVIDVGVGELLKEETALLESIETFEERALRAGRLTGISTGFPIFDEKMDGLQTGLVLVTGKWNTGKSALLQSFIINTLRDPTNYVLYFSIDDPVIGTTIPRFVANLSCIPINYVRNPLNRIDKNETLDDTEKTEFKGRRNTAIDVLKSYSGRLGLKDANEGYDTDYIEKTIKLYKVLAGNRKLVVFVDFLNMVIPSKATKVMSTTDKETELAGFFKHMAGVYDVPVVCTAENTKGVANAKVDESNIKGSASIQYRSDLTILLSSSFEVSDKSEMYFYDEKGVAQPIVKLQVSKNKMSDFRKDIYYKFYRLYSRFEECSPDEQSEYRRKK